MKKTRFISIRTKLVLSIGLVILFFGCIAGFFSFIEIQKTLIDLHKAELLKSTANEAGITNKLFQMSESIADHVASTSAVIDILAKPESQTISREKVRSLLTQFNIQSLFSSIYIIDTTGNAIVSTDTTFEGKNYAFRKYFQTAMQGTNGIDMAVGVTSKQPGFYFSSPIYASNTLLGVAVVKLEVRAITDQFLGKELPFKNYMLVGSDGFVLASNTKDRIYKHLGNPQLSADQVTETLDRYNVQSIAQLDYPEAFDIIKNQKGKQNLFELTDDLEDEREIITVTQIGDTPYYFVTEDYTEQIIKKAAQTTLSTLITQIIGILLTVYIAYIIISKFIRPLQQLHEIANKIGNEEYDVTMPFDSNDESNLLGTALISMAAKIKSSHATLQQEVKTKTAEIQLKLQELEKINSYMVDRELKMIELKKQIAELEKKVKA